MRKILCNKKLLPLYIVLPAAILFSVFLFFPGKDSRTFTELTAALFQDELSGNTLNLHYTLAYPENFGISHTEAVLPCYSAASYAASGEALDYYLEQLAGIRTEKLSEEQRHTYILLQRFLTQTREGQRFSYYEEPLSPSSGMQSQLPILLAEYAFRTVQDVEDYLALLDQTDDYFLSLLAYEQTKKENGLLQADTSLQQVREQCYAILSKQELNDGTHFLQTTFTERLNSLIQQNLLTETDAKKYEALNDRLLMTVMQPAYEDLADGLFLLMGDGTSTPVGLSAYPQGKDYYVWLMQKNTGSALSMEEIKEMLYPRFDTIYKTLNSLLSSREDAPSIWLKAVQFDPFPLSEPMEMLSDLQSRMTADFPAFPDYGFTASSPALAVKTVSPSLQEYCAPAFYLTPPLDDPENNVIYINGIHSPSGLELYTTLAHEGYPGHLYQSVYSQLTMQQKDRDPVLQLLWYGGYLEGWAVYVEFLSYDYAAQLALEQGNEEAALAYTIEKHNRDMQLCLYALLDVAIHYDNAPYEQIHQVLSSFGISDPDITRNVYDYIAEEPANYLKYYVGYLEILRLKEGARETWGEKYSDLRFHTFFLENGPSDFTTLWEQLSR